MAACSVWLVGRVHGALAGAQHVPRAAARADEAYKIKTARGFSGTGTRTGTFTGICLDTPLCGSLRFAPRARPPGKFSRKFMQPELGLRRRDLPRKR